MTAGTDLGVLRDLLWETGAVLAAEVDDQGTVMAASPAFEAWAGRELQGAPLADVLAGPQRPALEAALREAGTGWTRLTVGLLDGGATQAEDHRLHVTRAGQGALLVVAEPAAGERDALVEQVLALNDDLIAAQRAGHRRERDLQRAQADARVAADRVRQLEGIVLAGLSAPDLDGVIDALLDVARRVLGVEEAAVLLRSEEGGPLRAVGGGRPGDAGTALAELVLATREPQLGERPDGGALAAVPLVLEDEVAGVLVVGTAPGGTLGADGVALLVRVGDRAALALGTARLRSRERRIGETLQRSLLPERLPRLDGVELCARYLPRARGVHVGGDFYDAVATPDGRAVLALGDVAGKGLHAAAIMGQVRSALRAYALVAPGPGDVLELLDRFVAQGEAMATAVCVELSADRRSARIATAGHLPPLRAPAAGGAETIVVPVSPPLGLDHGARAEAVVELAAGDRLVLVTDGIVERRGTGLEDRLAELVAVVAGAPPSLPALCEHLLDVLSPDAGREFDDDVALLTARVG
ncbi:SpoIIE family protein phosphatase [Conexibacter sp. SYSU D00693]|uniref:SpoIIE family protein phosphatase n=1 Tax=Conexibacter sp. SYSU D00693 TaxID=2812560 RepID=UPI00196A2966|nr:SpoIIE family protein phosphatase [Conexibacter sp. SYSU D00693]